MSAADRRPWLIFALLMALAALPLVAPGYYVQFATKILLMGIAAMALNLVVGFGGLVSLCHGAFFGLAGYVLALTAPRYDPVALWWSLPLAVAAVALAALVIGALSLRTRGLYFIMVTLAFGEMLFYLFQDATFAGGSDGTFIYFKPTLTVAGLTLVDLEKPAQFFWLVLALAGGVVALLRLLVAAPFGRALRAARDNERRARSLGFPIYRLQLAAFVLSGALTALAGYFAAAQFGFVAPQMLGWHLSAVLLVMVLLGGLRSVAGPLLGAAALMGLEEVLKLTTEHWKLIEGLVIIGVVLAAPGSLRRLAGVAFGAGAAPRVHGTLPPAAAKDAGAPARAFPDQMESSDRTEMLQTIESGALPSDRVVPPDQMEALRPVRHA